MYPTRRGIEVFEVARSHEDGDGEEPRRDQTDDGRSPLFRGHGGSLAIQNAVDRPNVVA